MKVVITGGLGFLGLRLARAILDKGSLVGASGDQEPIEQMVLFDAVVPDERPAGLDERVEIIGGDISDGALVRSFVAGDSLSVFHFASVVSAGAEQDFDLALQVNLTGGLNVMDACRAAPGLPRFVFTSSMAVYGGSAMPETITDQTKITPQGTYGVTKVINEQLVADYTRKGFLDGRGGRPPTVIVRPGKPNAAASGFASGLFREPLSGVDYALPVSRDTRMVLGGYRTIVASLLALHEAPSEAIGDDRTINLPCFSATVEEMVASLRRVAGNRHLGAVTDAPDPAIQRICSTWPPYAKAERAAALGLPKNPSLDDVVREYIEDYVDG
jgi:nucleoside-diphosphate-sugar epimerase